ncbi:MAG TPA: hypothetical protein VF466_04810 [Candidatus Saccharimonadales bacterium]
MIYRTMALRVDKYQVRPGEPELSVLFLYPWGGDRHNNRQLLREISLLTGGLAIGAQTPGTGRIYIDRATRRSLRPGHLHEMADDYAGEVHEMLTAEGQPQRLLAAQSGRVALGARMQLSPHHPFTHVLLRDGVNLCAPESVIDGFRRLTSQPGEGEYGTYTERRNLLHKARDVRSLVHGRVEVLTQGRMLCSTESRLAVEALARDRTTPLYHLTFARGITGPVEVQREFRATLEALRPEDGAPLMAKVLVGNHNDLQHPLLFHDDITQTLLLTHPAPEPVPAPQA